MNLHRGSRFFFIVILGLTVVLNCRREEVASTENIQNVTRTELPLEPQPTATPLPPVVEPPQPQPVISRTSPDTTIETTKSPEAVRDVSEARKATITTLREIGDQLLSRWQSVRSVSAKLNTTLKREGRAEAGRGQRDMLKTENRTLVRSKLFIEFTMKNTVSDTPASYFTAERITKISDGEFLYRRWEGHDRDTWTKTWAKFPHIQYFGGLPLIRQLLQLNYLKRLEDEVVDGERFYVIRGMSQDDQTEITVKIAQPTGMMVHMKMNNKTQQAIRTISLSEIELNVQFPEDHFVFTAPEGVTVEDLTRQATSTPSAGIEP